MHVCVCLRGRACARTFVHIPYHLSVCPSSSVVSRSDTCSCVWLCVSRRRCWFPQLRSNSAVTQSPCECCSSSALSSLWSVWVYIQVCVCVCVCVCGWVGVWQGDISPLRPPRISLLCQRQKLDSSSSRIHTHTDTISHDYNSDIQCQPFSYLQGYTTLIDPYVCVWLLVFIHVWIFLFWRDQFQHKRAKREATIYVLLAETPMRTSKA